MSAATSHQPVTAEFTTPTGIRWRYWLSRPDLPGPLPLLLFLHGAGESGTNLQAVKIHGPLRVLESRPDLVPFIVAAPQATETQRPIVDRWEPEPLLHLVDHLVAEQNADPERVWVTGLSMGGFGTIRLLAHFPDRFAAGLAICGGGWRFYADRLRSMPLWLVHGADDEVVPAQLSIDLADALRQAGGTPRLTIYPGVKHDSWTQTYANPEVYAWLANQCRSQRGMS